MLIWLTLVNMDGKTVPFLQETSQIANCWPRRSFEGDKRPATVLSTIVVQAPTQAAGQVLTVSETLLEIKALADGILLRQPDYNFKSQPKEEPS